MAEKVVMSKERFSELILDYMDNKIEDVLEELNYDLEDGVDNLVVEYVEEVISSAAQTKAQRKWAKERNNDWDKMLKVHGVIR
jgi:hypothetical protein